jgi:anti-sigma regulatory factor (Ser/Thr protein kinase)
VITHDAVELPATLEAPRHLRARLESLRDDLGDRFHDVALVASELVANAVVHTDSSRVSVRLKLSRDRVRIEVSDDGHGFIPDDVARRWGIAVVEKLARRWGVHRGKRFTVWVEIPR